MADPAPHPEPPGGAKSLPGLAAAAQAARWAGSHPGDSRPGGSRLWHMMEDLDGSVLLLPLGGTDPGFAIMPCDDEFEVLVCDPEAAEEIGPFPSFEAALTGISWWLRLPVRWFELPDPDQPGDGASHDAD